MNLLVLTLISTVFSLSARASNVDTTGANCGRILTVTAARAFDLLPRHLVKMKCLGTGVENGPSLDADHVAFRGEGDASTFHFFRDEVEISTPTLRSITGGGEISLGVESMRRGWSLSLLNRRTSSDQPAAGVVFHFDATLSPTAMTFVTTDSVTQHRRFVTCLFVDQNSAAGSN